MSDFTDDLTVDTEHDSDLVKRLRKQIRDLGSEKDKALKELETFRTNSRKSTLADLFESKGVNKKVAAFYPADAEVDEDAVSKWLEEYGDVFGAAPAPAAQATSTEDEDEPPAAGLSPEQAAALRAVQDTQARGTTAETPLGTDRIRAVLKEAASLPTEQGNKLLRDNRLLL